MTIPSTIGSASPLALALPRNSHLPPYQQVAEELRQRIRCGDLQPGDRIPSARSLQRLYKIANGTAQSVVRTLRDEGLVHSTQGRGSFVADPLPPPAAQHPTSADTDAEPARMPTAEYTELSRRLDELTAVQSALLRVLCQAGQLRQDSAVRRGQRRVGAAHENRDAHDVDVGAGRNGERGEDPFAART